MARLMWATFPDAASPMGLQTYESSVMSALQGGDADGWAFERRTVSSLRAAPGGEIRLPARLLRTAGAGTASALGRWAYRGADAVHRFDLRLPPAAVPEVVTVHDLPPLRFADEGSLPPWSGPTLRRARAVITPSAFAAAEVAEQLGVEGALVVPNGVSTDFSAAQPLTTEERRVAGLDLPRYVLHAGGATARKNLPALAAAWRLLAPRLPGCQLVLAGPPDARRDAAFAGLPRVRLLGFCSHAQVGRLMAGASVVVVPSVYEGFGLPALEAMVAGAPVVAADRGALPEVCGDAAVLTEPTADGLAQGLEAVLADGGWQQELVRAGRARAQSFTWERSAALHLQAYERVRG